MIESIPLKANEDFPFSPYFRFQMRGMGKGGFCARLGTLRETATIILYALVHTRPRVGVNGCLPSLKFEAPHLSPLKIFQKYIRLPSSYF